MSQSIINDLKKNVIAFVDELIEQFPQETDLVFGRILLKDQMPAQKIMDNFVSKILPYKAQILAKDDDFFLKNSTSLFGGNNQRVNHLKVIWKSSRLDEEDRAIIWDWFKTFVYLCEKYLKEL